MGFTSDAKKEQDLLIARIDEAMRLCQQRNRPYFIGFLSEISCRHAEDRLKRARCGYAFCGGYPDAERRMLCVYGDGVPPEEEAYPFMSVAFRYRAQHQLTHRDFLGTLLSAGLSRDVIGDILCGNGLTVIFVRKEVVPFILQEIRKVGGEGVAAESAYDGELPVAHRFSDIRETIASPRIDVIIKALLHCSREQAAELILTDSVQVDHLPVSSVSTTVHAPVIISVRGFGRFSIDQVGPETKKGRLNLSARKYI